MIFPTENSIIFKDVVGYEGLYRVSSNGKIYSLISNKFLIPQQLKNGYCSVWLYKKGSKPKNVKVHRIVATAFIDNPLNLPTVNHKDEDKTNNRVENLEWCTMKYNQEYGTRMDKILKPVIQICPKNNTIIKMFSSIKEAEEVTKINATSICKVCKGTRKTAGKYKWRYYA